MCSRINFCSTVLLGFLISAPSFSKTKTGVITVQGIVPTTWEFNIVSVNSMAKFHLVPSDDVFESKIETIHMSYSNEGFTAGQLFIESENEGRLVASSNLSDLIEHQKYRVKLQDKSLELEEKILSTSMDKGYDLTVPATVNVQPKLRTGMTLEKTYNLHVVLPKIEYAQNAAVYTDKITFTFMDS